MTKLLFIIIFNNVLLLEIYIFIYIFSVKIDFCINLINTFFNI